MTATVPAQNAIVGFDGAASCRGSPVHDTWTAPIASPAVAIASIDIHGATPHI